MKSQQVGLKIDLRIVQQTKKLGHLEKSPCKLLGKIQQTTYPGNSKIKNLGEYLGVTKKTVNGKNLMVTPFLIPSE